MDNCQFGPTAPWAKDVDAATRLWKLSEQLVGQEFDIAEP